jgi:hypothetical protein
MAGTTALLVKIYEDVKQADLPEEFAVKAFDRLLATQLGAPDTPERRPAADTELRLAAIEAPGAERPASDQLGKAAARLGTTSDALGDLYDVDSGVPELVVSARKLEDRTAAAARQIAILVAAGRQAAGIEEWTPVSVIRDTCTNYKRNDTSNFGTTIASLSDVFLFRGSSRKREVKLSRPGWETAADVVKALLGGPGA